MIDAYAGGDCSWCACSVLCLWVWQNVCVNVCDACADLGSLSSLVKLRSLNVSNQGYMQHGYYDYEIRYYYVHVLTGEWRMQSVVWYM